MPGLFLGPKSISNARSPADRIMPDSVPDGHALVALVPRWGFYLDLIGVTLTR
jgi:hypothetical protein